MSLDTITFVKGALFSLLGNRLRLKDSQPLATHPRPLASTHAPRFANSHHTSRVDVNHGERRLAIPPPHACFVPRSQPLVAPTSLRKRLPTSRRRQTQHRDSGLGIRLIAGASFVRAAPTTASSFPRPLAGLAGPSKQSRNTVVQHNAPLAGEDIKKNILLHSAKLQQRNTL